MKHPIGEKKCPNGEKKCYTKSQLHKNGKRLSGISNRLTAYFCKNCNYYHFTSGINQLQKL